ncbi:MAG: fumarylacetoacetate hydrolase family protein [Bacteroidales bacterium]|nr:fumarylacetoacetate hydrolase family protein [Bacteroidales bacterium]
MKIICIGRNYLAHIKELKHPIPEEPLFFLKPDSSLLQKNSPFYYPDFSNNVHYECELVVKINRLGKSIPERYAKNYYSEVALGLDMTCRDIQEKEIANSSPWSISKVFDYSAPMSKFIELETIGKVIQDLNFKLQKNGETVQETNTSDMIFTVDKIIAYLSQYMTLKIGDMIFTGTPCGVGEVNIGDSLEGFLEGNSVLKCDIK